MNITAELISEWMNEAADEATEELRAEITQLRADLAESRASEHGLFGRLETCRHDEAALKAELEQEREARESSEEWADIGINLFGKIIYEFDACVDDSELTDDPMENYLIIIRQAIKNATRRNK